jgi:hypothetical protein
VKQIVRRLQGFSLQQLRCGADERQSREQAVCHSITPTREPVQCNAAGEVVVVG